MEALAAHRITHRDLAARNVFVFSFVPDTPHATCVKVGDFGLAMSMYQGETHAYGQEERLPYRWMAPEALRRRRFSEQSDVWAFGVTAWELLTGGDVPYFDVLDQHITGHVLDQGRRLQRPQRACEALWGLLERCFAEAPKDRPAFEELGGLLERLPPLLANDEVAMAARRAEAAEAAARHAQEAAEAQARVAAEQVRAAQAQADAAAQAQAQAFAAAQAAAESAQTEAATERQRAAAAQAAQAAAETQAAAQLAAERQAKVKAEEELERLKQQLLKPGSASVVDVSDAAAVPSLQTVPAAAASSSQAAPAAAVASKPITPGLFASTKGKQMMDSQLTVAVQAASDADVVALMEKVGASLDDVQRASTLNWQRKRLTAHDCKAVAHIIANTPTLTSIECAT